MVSTTRFVRTIVPWAIEQDPFARHCGPTCSMARADDRGGAGHRFTHHGKIDRDLSECPAPRTMQAPPGKRRNVSVQFHLNGYKKGDPDLLPGSDQAGSPSDLPESVDVLIVGSGPAGLTLATQLAAFPEISTCIVERKAGPLELGQADGIACRTMEMFNAFGFADRVLREGYWVNDLSFWRPSERDPARIVRGERVRDTEKGLSEFPHVILNQARVHDFYLERMRKSAVRMAPHYGWQAVKIITDPASADGEDAFPAMVEFERSGESDSPDRRTVRARYVVGCDGARSVVRRSMGLELRGDSANQAWGVMDILAVTDFPDIRVKCIINSTNGGSVVIIPREGGYLVRFYVELGRLQENERVGHRQISLDQIVDAARQVLNPYELEVKDVAWWSVYEIGQRLCDRFDDLAPGAGSPRVPRVFIAGDASHTHSPKAGQGMNVSMQDAFNLGWKLAAALRGQCAPELLRSYSEERQPVAKELIDFDREWASLLSAPINTSGNAQAGGVEPAAVQDYFIRHGRYTAGTATRYPPSAITGTPAHQELATGFEVGTRFHSAPVVRMADGKPIELGHAMEADGRWRLFAFAGAVGPLDGGSNLNELCRFLATSPDSPILQFTPQGADIDSVIDFRAIVQMGHLDVDPALLHPILVPTKGRFQLRDYEKVFCSRLQGLSDIFDLRGVDRTRGCLVLVRPDHYIANVLPLTAHSELGEFFRQFMIAPSAPDGVCFDDAEAVGTG